MSFISPDTRNHEQDEGGRNNLPGNVTGLESQSVQGDPSLSSQAIAYLVKDIEILK